MAVKLITDSGCDLSATQAEELGVILVPMTIHFEDGEFRSGFDLTTEEFFDKLAQAKELPTTSQPTPAAFEAEYEKIRANGDQAVVVCISSALSGTYQSAMIAADEYGDCVYVVDTKNVTIGQRILLEYAMELISKGHSAKKIAEILENVKARVCVLGAVDTLTYLIKGGRLSKAAGLAGTVLGIRPVLTVQDGALAVVGKARGPKAANTLVNQLILDAGIDFSMPYLLGYTGKDPSIAENYLSSQDNPWEEHKVPIASIGSTIGTHTGPGLLGIAFFKKA